MTFLVSHDAPPDGEEVISLIGSLGFVFDCVGFAVLRHFSTALGGSGASLVWLSRGGTGCVVPHGASSCAKVTRQPLESSTFSVILHVNTAPSAGILVLAHHLRRVKATTRVQKVTQKSAVRSVAIKNLDDSMTVPRIPTAGPMKETSFYTIDYMASVQNVQMTFYGCLSAGWWP